MNLDNLQEDVVFKKLKGEAGKLECNPHASSAQYVAATASNQLCLFDISAERSMLSMVAAHNRTVSGNSIIVVAHSHANRVSLE